MPAKTSTSPDLFESLGRCLNTLQRWELDARRGDVRSEVKPYYANGVFAGDLRDMAELLVRAQGEIAEHVFFLPTQTPSIPHMPTTTLARPMEEALDHLSAIAEFAYANGFHELGYNPVSVVREQCEKVGAEPVRIVVPFAGMVALSVRRPARPVDETERVLVYGAGCDFAHGNFDVIETIALVAESEKYKGVTHWVALQAPLEQADASIPLGSDWQHSGGDIYTVCGHTNLHSTQPERYPPSVVYVGPDGNVWSRAVSDWARSMTLKGGA